MKALYLLIAAAALAGCGPAGPDAEVKAKYVTYRVGGRLVQEFQLFDGTRCVVYVGYNIDCDWRRVVAVPVQPQ
jgi:hypothetical protein